MNRTERNEAKPHKYTESILKTVSYTKNKPKDTIQNGIKKRDMSGFGIPQLDLTQKGTLK